MNVCTLSGNIGGIDTVRYLTDGKAVLGLSIAMTEGYGDNKKTVWVKCSLTGKRAESLATILQIGMKATVNGRVGLQTWEPKNGKPGGAALSMWVNEIEFYGGSRKDGEAAPAPAPQKAKPAPQSMGDVDDDLPF